MLNPSTMTWTCMVCGEERLDAQISVAYRPVPGLEDRFVPDDPRSSGARCNVRFCNDRPACAEHANAGGPWTGPPAFA